VVYPTPPPHRSPPSLLPDRPCYAAGGWGRPRHGLCGPRGQGPRGARPPAGRPAHRTGLRLPGFLPTVPRPPAGGGGGGRREGKRRSNKLTVCHLKNTLESGHGRFGEQKGVGMQTSRRGTTLQLGEGLSKNNQTECIALDCMYLRYWWTESCLHPSQKICIQNSEDLSAAIQRIANIHHQKSANRLPLAHTPWICKHTETGTMNIQTICNREVI